MFGINFCNFRYTTNKYVPLKAQQKLGKRHTKKQHFFTCERFCLSIEVIRQSNLITDSSR